MKTSILFLLLWVLPLSASEWREVEVTAYCNEGPKGCSICCGKWAPLNKTASGKPPISGITVAASRSIPLGTRIEIEGIGVRVVQDRLAKRYDHRVDLFMPSHKEALKFGKKKLRIRILP